MNGFKRFVSGIRFRLMSWFTIILALVLIIFSAFVYTRQSQDMQGDNLNRLAIKVRQLENLFQFEGLQSMQDVHQLMPMLVSGGVALVQEDEVLVVSDPTTQWSSQLGPVSNTDVQKIVATAQQMVQDDQTRILNYSLLNSDTKQTQQYTFLIVPVEARGRLAGYMLLGRPADSSGQLPRLLATLILASLAVLAGAAGVGYWLAGRVLRPVKVITRTARQIGDTDLSKRLNLNSSDELGELADTFDDMLGRLQAAFERQRQFTMDASHELRTPLTIIGLETGRMLTARRKPEEYEQVLETIQSENDHMIRLVNDLLVLARMELGQTRIEPEAIDLSDVALEVVERLSPLAAAKGVRLDVGDLPETPVLGDRSHLVQMVSNLVGNGIKYAPAANGVVMVESGVNDHQAWVKVEDNGAGIALEDRPHIFERFYRADKSRTRGDDQDDPGGSGLGLAIVRWIAQAHGGDASLESEPGSGAVFKVTLPLRT